MITITNASKDVLDDVSDEKIGTEEFKKFDIKFEDGANAYGKIIKDVAYIQSINAPKVNDKTIEPKRGTKTYERVLKELFDKNITKVTINLQSSDSREAIKRLLSKGILMNPRNYTGLSIDEHPTMFDISDKINTIQLQENRINKMKIEPILPKESYQTKNILNENKSVKPDFTSNNKKFVNKLEEALGKKINTIKPDLIENSGKSLDRLKQLFEYNVIEGKPFEPLYKETGFIGEEDPVPDAEAPIEEVPTIEPETPTATDDNSGDVDTTTPTVIEPKGDETNANLEPKSDPLSFEELTTKKVSVLKDIATVQKEKIDQIFDYIEVLGVEVEKLITKTQEIDVLNDKSIQMQDQIDFLTPDTPEESLDKMVRISGGYTIDDYWKTWSAKNQGKEVVGRMPYYQNGVETSEPAQIKLPSYSDEQVKVSLGLK